MIPIEFRRSDDLRLIYVDDLPTVPRAGDVVRFLATGNIYDVARVQWDLGETMTAIVICAPRPVPSGAETAPGPGNDATNGSNEEG